jgi:Skp family chaperone for outer membrane proteins
MAALRTVFIASSLVLALSAAPALAQAPAQPKPAPAQPRPAQPAAQQPPPAQAAPAPAPTPPAPFPVGAKIGLVNLQTIAQLSVEGKTSTAKIQALISKKQAEAAARAKALQDSQTRLQQGGALLSDAARAQLEKDIERMNVESMRFEQDAQAEVNELQTELQNEFQKKLFPILEQIRKEKELHVLLSAQESGAIVVEPGIDLTQEAVKRLDALVLTKPAAAPAPGAPAPAAPAAPKP